MSERRGAIPSLIIFIFFLILGFLFAVPSPVDIGVMILDAFAKAIQPLDIELANRMINTYIIFLRIFGIILIAVDVLAIYLKFKRKEYW